MKCSQCGNCCRADMIAYITDSDIEIWKREHREEILNLIDNNERIWAGDKIVTSGGSEVKSCSFLRWHDTFSYCEIYDYRPKVCRNFLPGSSELCSLYKL